MPARGGGGGVLQFRVKPLSLFSVKGPHFFHASSSLFKPLLAAS